MRKGNSTGEKNRKELIKLYNTVHWDPRAGDKVYLDSAHLVIDSFRLATRNVILRFADGPGLDICLVDMDRLVLAYLKLRGVKPPRKLEELAKGVGPPRCDFIVPNHLLPKLPKPPPMSGR